MSSYAEPFFGYHDNEHEGWTEKVNGSAIMHIHQSGRRSPIQVSLEYADRGEIRYQNRRYCTGDDFDYEGDIICVVEKSL